MMPLSACSIYSSEEDDDDIEMYEHDYDGMLSKGKRHLGKTRWTREEVTCCCMVNDHWYRFIVCSGVCYVYHDSSRGSNLTDLLRHPSSRFVIEWLLSE